VPKCHEKDNGQNKGAGNGHDKANNTGENKPIKSNASSLENSCSRHEFERNKHPPITYRKVEQPLNSINTSKLNCSESPNPKILSSWSHSSQNHYHKGFPDSLHNLPHSSSNKLYTFCGEGPKVSHSLMKPVHADEQHSRERDAELEGDRMLEDATTPTIIVKEE
jgi:hypothetical protein